MSLDRGIPRPTYLKISQPDSIYSEKVYTVKAEVKKFLLTSKNTLPPTSNPISEEEPDFEPEQEI
jgi:hypothetical protein